MRKNERGITLIALVVTIVVLIIFAGVSISMLTGENGIITQAQKSKLQTEIGKEKEYITLSVSAVKGDKISRGDTSEITSRELQNEINNYTDEATVTGSKTLIVTYESGRSYEVEQDGSITQKEELTPEEAKKIVFTVGCGFGSPALLVEIADGTVYYVDNLQKDIMQKIEITDAKIITTNGIRDAAYAYFIDNQGKVYTWGKNEDSNISILCISDIEGNPFNGKNIVNIQSDGNTMIAIDNEGKVYTWGNNRYGQLGNGTDVEYSTEPECISDIPENALNGKNIVEVQCAKETMIAIDNEGKVYTWGNNYNGKLGNGTGGEDGDYSAMPICISNIDGNALNGKNIVEVQSENYTIIALDREGKVYTWGDNTFGQLGNGTIGSSNIPICISDIDWNALNGKNIVEVQSGADTIVALDNEGKVYTWGRRRTIQLDNEIYESGIPICITDYNENILYNKKIKLVKITTNNGTGSNNYISYVTQEGELYNYNFTIIAM